MSQYFSTEQSKATILVVDDSAENLQVIHSILKDDYHVKVAKSGPKALEIVNKEPRPDLVLLDIVMPEMNGFEVCERIKSNPLTQKITVIFLTSLHEVADETMGFQKGGADFINKPINPDIVKARIKTHIELQNERRKSEELLKVLLPNNVIHDLMHEGRHRPMVYENVSILFSDFVGFTKITSRLDPEFLIAELNELYGRFDEICEEHGCTRIKTIGDAYLATCGLLEDESSHADRLVHAGLDFISFLSDRNRGAKQAWTCRMGINSGRVVAGIVGKTRFIYDIFGDDVNIASRIEGVAEEMTLMASYKTAAMLSDKFIKESRGTFPLKGTQDLEVFNISGRR